MWKAVWCERPRGAGGVRALCDVASTSEAQIFIGARRNQNESFSTAQWDQALARASNAVSRISGPADSGCPTSFARSGSLGTFSGPNDIANAGELSTVLGTGGALVKVVNEIRFCDDQTNISFIGCARFGSAIVEDVSDTGSSVPPDPAVDGVMWAHELGHAFGLKHRTNNSRAIMFPNLAPNNVSLNSGECDVYFRNDSITAPFQFSNEQPFPASAAAAEEGADVRTGPMPIEEFAQRIIVDVTPIDDILRYGPADVPVLLRMLADRRKADTWPMVTNVLGMIGDDTTASELIAFIETRRAGRISRAEYNGIQSAIQALGFLASRAGSPVALDYLMKASEPEFWARQRNMRWISVATPSMGHRDHRLASVAAMGLGLSGDSQALGMLQRRWDETVRGRRVETGEEQRDMLDVLEQAMRDNTKVSRVGLESYYRD